MERTTHKNRHPGRRVTRKNQNQRGGVKLDTWPLLESREEWKAALGEKWAKLLDAKSTVNPEYLDLWFRVLEDQDELFDIALQLMMKRAGLEGTEAILSADPEALEARRSELVAFLTDVEQMVNFNKDTGKNGVTKLIQIQTNKSEPLLSLFLFPKRLHNMFLESLANIFVALKADQSILSQITNPVLTNVAAAQYRSYVLSNIMTNTGTIQRDGYYLNYPTTKINDDLVANKTDVFYNGFLTEIMAQKDAPFDALFTSGGECTHFIADWPWEKIAAHVFLAYKMDRMDDILTLFGTDCSLQTGLDTKYYPEDYKEVTVRGVRFGTLFSNISYLHLEFILQLCQKIRTAPTN